LRLRRVPARLAPPWRGYAFDPAAKILTLHTVQHADAYQQMLATGVMRPERRADDDDFAEAYDWMLERMDERLPTSGPGMVWCWAKIRRRDLVGSRRRARGEVLVTCRVARERVLLSHFDDWHQVLNRTLHVPQPAGEDFDNYWARAEPLIDSLHDRATAAGLPTDTLQGWPDDLRRELEASWEGIFDHTVWTDRSAIQATLHEIRLSEVVRAVRIR
jgi:hypothetical protein